jgi:hypothetical protein
MNPCAIIKGNRRHLCWTASSGWDLSAEEMCEKCQTKYEDWLTKKLFKKGEINVGNKPIEKRNVYRARGSAA